jgi:tRNA(Ile)-lysidine synthase
MMTADNAQFLSRVQGTLEQATMQGVALVVGLSGGVDSVVLLHCLRALAPKLDLRLSALHIHHGLSANADDWALFCADLCAAWDIPLKQARVAVDQREKLGVEAAAREARYAVFRALPADAIALAHHRDDQIETMLLQLLRGAGVRGLSAMPVVRVLNPQTNLRIVRPLLHRPRADIVRYAKQAGLQWVEDEANVEMHYDRNFLRLEVLPTLIQRFPGAPATLQRAAENFADAAQLLDDLAQQDAVKMREGDTLDVDVLRALSPARARNVLRWFMEQRGLPLPKRDQLEEALRQALHARGDARVEVKLGSTCLHRHRGRIHLDAALSAKPAPWSCLWSGEAEVSLPCGLGCVTFEPAVGAGLSLERLRGEPALLRPRRGGERLRMAPRRPSRTLKNLLQEHGVPAWRRATMPLLFRGENLVWVPDIGIDHRFAAQSDEAGVLPRWIRGE